jgi:hypothetical protein
VKIENLITPAIAERLTKIIYISVSVDFAGDEA